MMDDEEIIQLIEDYAKAHSSFNTGYICDIRDRYDQFEELSPGQRDACENIIARFRMAGWNDTR